MPSGDPQAAQKDAAEQLELRNVAGVGAAPREFLRVVPGGRLVGWEQVRWRNLTGGIAAVHHATAPQRPGRLT